MKTKLLKMYEMLSACYGDLHWWPAKTPYEVIVGAVLTQNTAWNNVEKAINNFGGNLSPEFILNSELPELAKIIRPAGFFNQKAVYLKETAKWFQKYGFDVPAVKSIPLEIARKELLSVKGVGKETADSILLYAFDFPSFVVDAYTFRLCERFPINAGTSYDRVKGFFENNLPSDVRIYNNFHALIVINAKKHCRKKPICGSCPLETHCLKNGV